MAAIVYFVGALIDNLLAYAQNGCAVGINSTRDIPCVDAIALPDIPPALLGLTSLAALTYVGAKTVAREGVRIMGIREKPANAGSKITIVLVNVPKSLASTAAFVTFATVPPPPPETATTHTPSAATLVREGETTTLLTVDAPSTPGIYLVTVTTPAGTTPAVEVTMEAAPV